MRYIVRAFDEMGMLPADRLERDLRAAGSETPDVMVIESHTDARADEPEDTTRTFVFVMDAASRSELDATLRKLPMYPVMSWQATPTEAFERMGKALAHN